MSKDELAEYYSDILETYSVLTNAIDQGDEQKVHTILEQLQKQIADKQNNNNE